MAHICTFVFMFNHHIPRSRLLHFVWYIFFYFHVHKRTRTIGRRWRHEEIKSNGSACFFHHQIKVRDDRNDWSNHTMKVKRRENGRNEDWKRKKEIENFILNGKGKRLKPLCRILSELKCIINCFDSFALCARACGCCCTSIKPNKINHTHGRLYVCSMCLIPFDFGCGVRSSDGSGQQAIKRWFHLIGVCLCASLLKSMPVLNGAK